MKKSVIINTPLGPAQIQGNEQGISAVRILSETKPASEIIPADLQQAKHQLDLYFSGELKEFDLKLNPEGTEFQQKIWKLLLNIPFGRRISYLELAKEFGDPKAIRAVAVANGKNPLWILIPCHRVVGSDGSLTGYAGGLWRKKWLLEHEAPQKQQVLFS